MAAYATSQDVQARMSRTLSSTETTRVDTLLDDAALMIDAIAIKADGMAKKAVSCNMVMRALGSGGDIPIGATQGSMAALGYSQSWTIGGGSNGELYISKADRRMLGLGSKMGCYSPVESLVEG